MIRDADATGWPASQATSAPALPPAPPYRAGAADLCCWHRVTPAGPPQRGPGPRELTGSAVEVVPPMVESGTELAGRYRLDRRLGTGGMGEVWQARDLKFERDLDLRRDDHPDALRGDPTAATGAEPRHPRAA